MRRLRRAAIAGRTTGKGLRLAWVTLIALLSTRTHADSVPPTDIEQPAEDIEISATAPGIPMPHFWERMMGSGRAILSLRDSYRQDLRAVKSVTDLGFVRFHAILQDEVGVVTLDRAGQPVYNFSYVDQIYDGLLENGIRPFVEIDFMPTALTSRQHGTMSFWYHPNVAPPKSYARWEDLVRDFATHLVARYGIDEVAQWYFEVWNEPNIDFWQGKPRLRTYLKLYEHTARAIKAVDSRLRVGGPATAQAAWITDFLQYATSESVPVDFVSSHVYANDKPEDVFGEHGRVARDRMVCRAVRKMHDDIRGSPMPDLPLIVSEFNASYRNEPNVTDAVYMGPWLADTIRQCAGSVDLMSYWSFSDVFEEQGVVKTPFYGGFGLIAERGIPKPAFNAFALLHKLGAERLPVESPSALVTRRPDGTLVVALWNYAEPAGAPSAAADPTAAAAHAAAERRFKLHLTDVTPDAAVRVWRVDTDHGNVMTAFDAMHRPRYPNREEVDRLKAAATLPPPESSALHAGQFDVSVPPYGLAVLEIAPQSPAR
jgi:xylan 1,4-beta-xylosidase